VSESFLNELSDLAAGKAGEYLVCADLILRGHVAFPSEQGLPYDVVADIGGGLLKIQVKTTRTTRPVPQRASQIAAYLFHIKRCGKGGKKTYLDSDADIFALVALDTRCVAYLRASDAKRTMIFRSPALRGKYKDEIDRKRADLVRAEYSNGLRGFEISAKHGIDRSVVTRLGKRLVPSAGISSPYLDTLTLEVALQ
jgi:hypothetical protein